MLSGRLTPMLQRNRDLVLINAFGFVALVLASLTSSSQDLALLRWVFVVPYMLFMPGYVFSLMILSQKDLLPNSVRLLASSTFSLILFYPAGLLNILLLERKTNIFRPHLPGDILFLFLITLAFSAYTIIKKRRASDFPWRLQDIKKILGVFKSRTAIPLILLIALSLFLNLYNLDQADIFGDEYSISFKSYDLVDGNVPGRDAYAISFKDHGPGIMYINHFFMHALNPTGYYNLDDWMIRFGPALVGVLCTIFVFYLARLFFDGRAALLSAILFATCNYTVWMGRILHREIFLTFFMLSGLYFFLRFWQGNKRGYMFATGITLGGALLVKFTGAILLLTFLIFALLKDRSRIVGILKILLIAALIFSPVILFNIAAYVTTGYTDVAFASLFGTKSYMGTAFSYAPPSLGVERLADISLLLIDLYSLPLFLFFTVLSLASLKYIRNSEPLQLLWVFMLSTLAFFWVIGVRAYYLPFITIPFAILSAFLVFRIKDAFKGRVFGAVLLLLLGMTLASSVVYTFNTNHSASFTYIGPIEYTRPGSEVIPPSLEYPFSRNSKTWSDSYGFKELRGYLLEKLEPGDILLIDDRLRIQALEWYFTGKIWEIDYGKPFPQGRFAKKGIKTDMLSNITHYESPYVILLSEINPQTSPPENQVAYERAIEILKSEAPLKIFRDKSGNTMFYVYLVSSAERNAE
jgi:hypothetical protein